MVLCVSVPFVCAGWSVLKSGCWRAGGLHGALCELAIYGVWLLESGGGWVLVARRCASARCFYPLVRHCW